MIVLLSEIAINQLKKAIAFEAEAPPVGVRIGVQGGGCSGFSYVLRFVRDTEVKEDWIVEDNEGLKIYIDPISAMYLEGTSLDYVQGEFQSGFKFTNPKVTHTCGCGQSFSY
jgi:iron-sulfur cluster assembly accessory protein